MLIADLGNNHGEWRFSAPLQAKKGALSSMTGTHPLPLRVTPGPRETVPSFLSRMAATNGSSATDFSRDMGFSVKQAINLNNDALQRLAEISGLTELQSTEMVSWTGQRLGNVRTAFRGETFVSRAVRSPAMRGCPVCLRDDALDQPEPLRAMIMRGDWQVRGVDICIKHRHPLVVLWRNANLFQRYDIGTRLSEVLPEIVSGRFEQPDVEPSAYDFWLSKRFENGLDNTALAKYSVFPTMTLCKALGSELLRQSPDCNPKDQNFDHKANAVGFEVAKQGEPAIRSAFDKLAEMADGALDEPKKAFGQIFVKLNRYYIEDDEFAPFRKILRDCILDVWPYGRGETVLGVELLARRLHSIRSASFETGIGPSVLSDFLTEAGAFAPNDDRPNSRKTFDAALYAGLLAEIPKLVGPIEMRRIIGATRAELMSLEEDEVLPPFTKVSTIKSPWRIADGQAFIAELSNIANDIGPNEEGWETLQQTRKRSAIKLGTLFQAIRDGQLQLGKLEGAVEYNAFLVCRSEVDAQTAFQEERRDYRQSGLEGVMSVAEFGRSIGLRNKGQFSAFCADHQTPTIKVHHTHFKQYQLRVTNENIDAFHQRFLTITTMSSEFSLHRNSILALIRLNSIPAFAPDGQNYGPIYLREVVQPVLRKAAALKQT